MGKNTNCFRIILIILIILSNKMKTVIPKLLDFNATLCWFLVLILSFYADLPAVAAQPNMAMPFKPGEKLVYQLRWGIVPAGSATLEVLENKSMHDMEARHFRLTAQTNAFVDTFYMVRDVVESFTDQDIDFTLLYKQKQQEGNTKRDVTIFFDLPNMEARYRNNNVDNDPIAILPGTLDPLSSLYYIRNTELKAGLVISKPVTDGKKNLIAEARVIKRESVTVRGEKYDTFLVEPDLKGVRGVFDQKKGSRIKLWFTADDRHLLVKIKSKVAVGSFYGVLVDKENVN